MNITNEFAIRSIKRSKDREYPYFHPTLEVTHDRHS
jgi:hypothetical protein